MKSLSIITSLLFFLISSSTLYSTTVNAERWTNKPKMECMQYGGKWRNGSCIKKNSSSSKSSQQVSGNSEEYYYSKKSAIDIAQTELKNNAAKYCGSSYKTQIDWDDYNTSCKTLSGGRYKCKVYGTANCKSQSCNKRYCGSNR